MWFPRLTARWGVLITCHPDTSVCTYGEPSSLRKATQFSSQFVSTITATRRVPRPLPRPLTLTAAGQSYSTPVRQHRIPDQTPAVAPCAPPQQRQQGGVLHLEGHVGIWQEVSQAMHNVPRKPRPGFPQAREGRRLGSRPRGPRCPFLVREEGAGGGGGGVLAAEEGNETSRLLSNLKNVHCQTQP